VGKVVGARLTRNEVEQINKLVGAGLYLHSLRLLSGKLSGKTGLQSGSSNGANGDCESAKKEVAGYFQIKGEAYASDASTNQNPGGACIDGMILQLSRSSTKRRSQIKISSRPALEYR